MVTPSGREMTVPMEPTMIEGRTSIESEPRTLSPQQLHCAREAALFVLNTETLEEALRIFTEGLQPAPVRGAGRWDGEVAGKKRKELKRTGPPVHQRLSRQVLLTELLDDSSLATKMVHRTTLVLAQGGDTILCPKKLSSTDLID